MEHYLTSGDESVSRNQGQKGYLSSAITQNAVSTLYDHDDYVRTICYAKPSKLYSAADNGVICAWDLHVEKLIHKFK